jgi:hypothetical protein
VTILFHTVLFVHFLGLAALVGGTLVQVPRLAGSGTKVPQITYPMLHGALTQLLSGLALWGIVRSGLHQPLPEAKMIVKLGVLVVVLGALWSERAKERIADGLLYTVLGLCAAEIAVAVFWT